MELSWPTHRDKDYPDHNIQSMPLGYQLSLILQKDSHCTLYIVQGLSALYMLRYQVTRFLGCVIVC